MALGHPSMSIPLGSALLEAAGDVKGMMRALGDEAKAAKADARSAQSELRAAERDAKKAQAAIDKIERKGGTVTQEQRQEAKRLQEIVDRRAGDVSAKAQAASTKKLRLDREKQERKDERDRIKSMGAFERRINGRLTSVRDGLSGVSQKLMSSDIPALKRAGAGIGRAAGGLTSAMSSSGAQSLLSGAGAVAGMAGIAAGAGAVAFGVALGAERVINRNIEEIRTRAATADMIRNAFRSFAGLSVSGQQIGGLNASLMRAPEQARRQMDRESLTSRVIGTDGFLAEMFGTSEANAKRIKANQEIMLDDAKVAGRFGEAFAASLDVEKIMQDPSFARQTMRDTKKTEGLVSGSMRNLAGLIGYIPGGGTLASAGLEAYVSAEDNQRIREAAEKQRKARIAQVEAQIENDKKRMREDARGASKRKQEALRVQSLESERLRRQMQTARF